MKLKSIKLSDSYQVQVRINQNDKEPIILYECSSVTLPTIKMKSDIIQYGNNSKMFIYPDYSNIGELELEFIEHYSVENALCIQNFVNVCLNKLFNQTDFSYNLFDYVYELIIKVYGNNFKTCVLEHVFHNLKLVDYTKYDLDYSSTDIAKWTLKFMFQEYFAGRPSEVEAVLNPPEPEPPSNAAEEAYNAGQAMMDAHSREMSRGRGMQTPTENLAMAKDRLANLQKEQAAKGTITQEESVELSTIKKRKALLTSELEKIEKQEAAINDAVTEEKKKTEIRDPNKDPTGALSDVVKRTTEELHVEEASKAMSNEVKNIIDNSGLQENSMALANMIGDMSVALGRALGMKKDEVTDVAAPELTAAPEYTPPKMTKADIIAELNELNEYEAEIKQNIANRELNNKKEAEVIRDQISRFENDNNRSKAIDPVDLHDRTAAMEESVVALERVNWTTERKDFESKNRTNLTSDYDTALDSGNMDRNPLSPDYLELLNEDFEFMEEIDQMSTKDILHDTIGLSDTTKAIMSNSDNNQDQNSRWSRTIADIPELAFTTEPEEEEPEEQVPKAVTREPVLLNYSKDQYSLIKSQMSVNDVLNASSNNNSGAYAITATSLFIGNESRLLDNDNVYGKDVVSQKTINKINATNKATAESIEFNPTSVDELKKGLENFSNEDDDALYVISVDPSKVSGITRWGLKTFGGDYAEKLLTEGYAVTIHKGNVGEGVGNINKQKNEWLSEFSKYEFYANRVLKSGDLQFKVMKVTTK